MATNDTSLSTEMHELYIQWQQSNLSKKQFSTLHQVNYHKFIYWCNRFFKQESKPGFIPLEVSGPSMDHSSTAGMELIFPSGVRIVLSGKADPSYIRSLVL
jgi:hypothetical protein